jgi:spore maturation protein CgeB
MKILVSGHHNPLYLTFVEYFENAVKNSGHDLLSFDDRQFLLPGRLRQKIGILQKIDLERMNDKLFLFAKKNRPDLIIITQGHYTLKETIKNIKSLKIPIVLWIIDAPINFSNILDSAHYYDFIFCGGTEAIEILEKHGIKKLEWLPFACSPDLHFPDKSIEIQNSSITKDIVFVGSHYPSREHIFESLNLGKYSFGIWGSGWDKVSSSSPLKKSIQKTHTKPDEWIKIYSQSKIVLVTHYAENNGVLCYQASPKIYEALACGTFLICDNQKDIRTLFKDGKHLVIFSDIKDLNEKIIYYLAHQHERKIIAKKGRQEALDKHTYLHRINQILDALHSIGIVS